VPLEDSIFPGDIKRILQTQSFGKRIYYLPEVTSVNDVALELVRLGEQEGTLVISDFQSRGRGRLKREWQSPPQKNLLLALILRPGAPSVSMLPLTLAFSITIADVLESVLEEPVMVKWPNDVVVNREKICGILAEGTSIGGLTDHIVMGIGVNVNMEKDDFTREVKMHATSCRLVKGAPIVRRSLLARLLYALEDTYAGFLQEGFAPLVGAYNRKLVLVGRRVSFAFQGEVGKGLVVGARRDGALEVEISEKKALALYNEEIKLLE
jgi:BirA family biotin operon repressor/biotin-[acetyl-CoA-carboxylase] ligase